MWGNILRYSPHPYYFPCSFLENSPLPLSFSCFLFSFTSLSLITPLSLAFSPTSSLIRKTLFHGAIYLSESSPAEWCGCLVTAIKCIGFLKLQVVFLLRGGLMTPFYIKILDYSAVLTLFLRFVERLALIVPSCELVRVMHCNLDNE